MATLTLGYNINTGGTTINKSVTRTAPTDISTTATAAAAKAGTLTARTDADTGSATVASHGLADGDIVDLYWTGGSRYGMTVGTISGNVIPLDGGAGTDLPATSTAVKIVKQQVLDIDFVANKAKWILASGDKRSTILFYEGSTLRLALVVNAGEPWFWISDQLIANPLAGYTISSIRVSQEDTTAQAVRISVGYDSTL